MATRIKICGVTTKEVAQLCVHQGVDAIGLVFCPTSSRAVSGEKAKAIVRGLSPFTQIVGLFMNASREEVASVLDKVPLTLLQFHGEEEASFCESFKRPYLKSIGMGKTIDIRKYMGLYQSARGFLLDSNVRGMAGGSGHTFDWSTIPSELKRTIILAGGLNIDNIAEAIRTVQPYAVDLSSGVESSKGVKSPALIKEFIQEIKRVENNF